MSSKMRSKMSSKMKSKMMSKMTKTMRKSPWPARYSVKASQFQGMCAAALTSVRYAYPPIRHHFPCRALFRCYGRLCKGGRRPDYRRPCRRRLAEAQAGPCAVKLAPAGSGVAGFLLLPRHR